MKCGARQGVLKRIGQTRILPQAAKPYAARQRCAFFGEFLMAQP
jgi:hypothetical protein